MASLINMIKGVSMSKCGSSETPCTVPLANARYSGEKKSLEKSPPAP